MKSILKKVLGIALTASLALGIIGCSDGSSDDSTSGSSGSTDNFTGTGNFDYSTCVVGDFILKDGSILSRTETPESGSVVAIIVRPAAGGKPALGMGITIEQKAWCLVTANGSNTNITELYAATHTDGDGLSKLRSACADTSTSLEKYSAWDYCRNYGSINGISGSIASGWYLSTKAELETICGNKATINTSLGKAGKSGLGSYYYVSCNQYDDQSSGSSYIWNVYFLNGSATNASKTYSSNKVIAVRAFN